MSTLSIPATKENGMRAFIKRNPLFSMYLIMFTLAWSIMIPQALYSQGMLSQRLPEILEILTGWAPAVAAIVVSAVLAGRAGVLELMRRFLIWRVGVQWHLIVTFLIAAIILGGIGLHIAFGSEMPVIPAAGAPAWEIGLTFLVFVLLGFLINTEEVAWRGAALPCRGSRSGMAHCLLRSLSQPQKCYCMCHCSGFRIRSCKLWGWAGSLLFQSPPFSFTCMSSIGQKAVYLS
jgi:hypothetical protein